MGADDEAELRRKTEGLIADYRQLDSQPSTVDSTMRPRRAL